MRRPCERGQAAVETLALVPLLVATVLLIWQLVALAAGAMSAHELARARAIEARGGSLVHVRAVSTVPSLLPGIGPLAVPVRAAIHGP